MSENLSLEQVDRAAVVKQLMKLIAESRDRTITVLDDQVEVEIEDIVSDTHRFLRQAVYRLATRMSWPCVVINRVDLIDGQPTPRFVPIDLPDLLGLTAASQQAILTQSREDGVSISERSVEQASDGFFSGVAEAILGRARSILLGTVQNPEVKITTNPQGVKILFSKGHFLALH